MFTREADQNPRQNATMKMLDSMQIVTCVKHVGLETNGVLDATTIVWLERPEIANQKFATNTKRRIDMAVIELKNGYFIEVDQLNYTLKQKYQGKTRDGELKESEKICGYFGKIRKAIDKYIELTQLDVLGEEAVSLEQYVETVERSNTLAVQGLESVLAAFSIK